MSTILKNAIILTCFLRNYEETFEDLKYNLRNSDEIDLFISTWNFLVIKKINKEKLALQMAKKGYYL